MSVKNYLLLLSLFFSVCAPLMSQTAPCECCSEENRQFDFWIGEWEVTNDGKMAGTNTITFVQDSCVLRENWKSARSKYSGTSYNFYDKKIKKWRQLWLDNYGDALELSGEYVDGKMVLESEEQYSEAFKGNYMDRVTWTKNEDGTVRQHWQQTRDGGKTWVDIFDGLYKRKKQTSSID